MVEKVKRDDFSFSADAMTSCHRHPSIMRAHLKKGVAQAQQFVDPSQHMRFCGRHTDQLRRS